MHAALLVFDLSQPAAPPPPPPPVTRVNTYTTVLANAVGITEDYIIVADPTGILHPDSGGCHHSTPTLIQIDREYMQVTSRWRIGSSHVPVIRAFTLGWPTVAFPLGTNAVPHAAGAMVTITTSNSKQFLLN